MCVMSLGRAGLLRWLSTLSQVAVLCMIIITIKDYDYDTR